MYIYEYCQCICIFGIKGTLACSFRNTQVPTVCVSMQCVAYYKDLCQLFRVDFYTVKSF